MLLKDPTQGLNVLAVGKRRAPGQHAALGPSGIDKRLVVDVAARGVRLHPMRKELEARGQVGEGMRACEPRGPELRRRHRWRGFWAVCGMWRRRVLLPRFCVGVPEIDLSATPP